MSSKAPKKSKTTPATNNKKRADRSLIITLLPFILLALSLIIETCLILSESAGKAGMLIHDIFLGLFGHAAHLGMISVMLIAFFFDDLRKKGTLRFKAILAAASTVSAAAALSLIATGGMKGATLSFADFYKSGALGESGGVFGDLIALILSKLITPTPAIIVSVLATLVLLSFTLGKSRLGLWRLFSKHRPEAAEGKKKSIKENDGGKGQTAPAVPQVESGSVDTLLTGNTATVPELPAAGNFSLDENGGSYTDFSVSDGSHTIEAVDFSDTDDKPAGTYKPADLMEEFGLKEQPQKKQDIYDDTPKPAPKPEAPRRKINVSGRGYSPFVSPLGEKEFNEGKTAAPTQTDTGRPKAYSPFSDPITSMHDNQSSSPEPSQAVMREIQEQARGLDARAEAPQVTEAPYTAPSYTAPAEPIIPTPPFVQTPPIYEEPTEDEEYDQDCIEEYEEEQTAEIPVFTPPKPIYAPTPTPPPAPKPEPTPVYDEEDDPRGFNPFGTYNKLRYPKYIKPPVELLDPPDVTVGISENEIYETQRKIVDIFQSFNIQVTLTGYSVGPTITRYEITPGAGVKFKQIANLEKDLGVHLQSDKIQGQVRIVTVPGKSVIGIEVPNSVVKKVALRSLVADPAFQNAKSKITVCLGLAISGKAVFMNIDNMPHLLVAGQTKSGKSVAINCIIMSLIYRASPDEVQLLLVDPKRVELSIYNNIPHLIMPVIDEPNRAAAALKWAVDEMDRRYEILRDAGVRTRDEYYSCRDQIPNFEYLPQIVIIIDELADLMLQAKEHVEGRINRLAAMARACGMHLVIGTQRPSVDVITGLIKANIPSQIAFSVTRAIDSTVILNVTGAEKLLGKGDMLFHEAGKDIKRVQGAFVDTPEIKRVLNFIFENNGKAVYNPEIMYALQQETDKLNKVDKKPSGDEDYATDCSDIDFELLCQAVELIIQMGGGISKNIIQRKLSIGFNRSANIFDKLEELGFISGPQGNKPRDVTVTWEQYQQWRNNHGK